MHRSLLTIVSLMMMLTMAHAQRKVQSLGRGVVAVQSGTNVNITWRRLAQESEDAKYNVYVSKTADGTRTLLNAKPLSMPQATRAARATRRSIPTRLAHSPARVHWARARGRSAVCSSTTSPHAPLPPVMP